MRFEDREDVEYVASATECTGQAPALDGGDEDARRALYDVQKAKRPRKRNKR